MHHVHIRRAMTGAALALAGLAAAATPALAISDGTSNTIQFSVASAALDQAHHRVTVDGAARAGLAPGKRLASARIVTPRGAYMLENVMVESLAGTTTALSLNFTKIEALLEPDGTYPPFG